jgi:hypothetical protein
MSATHQLFYPPPRTSPRHLFIVSRAFIDLYDYLTERFSDDSNVAVILDRRWSERRRAGSELRAHQVNRRRGHRRVRTELDEELRTMPHVVVSLSERPSRSMSRRLPESRLTQHP